MKLLLACMLILSAGTGGLPGIDILLPALFGPQLTALLAMIAAQVLLAVAVAIRTEQFDWKRLPDFYRKMVVPLLIGWVATGILAKFAGPNVLGPVYGNIAAEGVTWAAWLAVVASLGDRIVSSGRQLWGTLIPFKADQTPPTS